MSAGPPALRLRHDDRVGRRAEVGEIRFAVVAGSWVVADAPGVIGARFEGAAATAPHYRLAVMIGPDGPTPVLFASGSGRAIDVDLWTLSETALARVERMAARLARVRPVTLARGAEVLGLLHEPPGLVDAVDITDYGSWRAFLAEN